MKRTDANMKTRMAPAMLALATSKCRTTKSPRVDPVDRTANASMPIWKGEAVIRLITFATALLMVFFLHNRKHWVSLAFRLANVSEHSIAVT